MINLIILDYSNKTAAEYIFKLTCKINQDRGQKTHLKLKSVAVIQSIFLGHVNLNLKKKKNSWKISPILEVNQHTSKLHKAK